MTEQTSSQSDLVFRPLTPDLWPDLETLFGEHGASSGCWCMWWRLSRKEFAQHHGNDNKESLRRIVETGEVPGILAYAGSRPVGWCSVCPREVFHSLERSPTLKRVDNVPVWSVVCFYIAPAFRRRGVAPRLLNAAVEYARQRGARIVEGYPLDTSGTPPSTSSASYSGAYMGTVSMFRQAGFTEALRRSQRHPIMRHLLP